MKLSENGVHMQLDKYLGLRARQLRERYGVSQAMCAAVIGVAAKTYDAYESGEAPIPATALMKLSEYFNVQISFFFDTDDEPDEWWADKAC